ncbi:methyltransferase-like protein 24 [Acipenser oxyrinchus oxyrinchus]|uniref:Methyltransferase-like protein 24 n=1 Tax=Acipenser oxyrinchus oxyrinchus TaxID=40147 RepID=A0AAD8GCP5_ACIOX|nr:methyltransferase-like protein 24 [Acipenser oxyrinchus oxyrinchus]
MMSKDKFRKAFALHICLIFTTLLIAVQIYMEFRSPQSSSFFGRLPTPDSHSVPDLSRDQGRRRSRGRGADQADLSRDMVIKRQVSFVRSLKRNPAGLAAVGGTESPEKLADCCPLQHQHRKSQRWHIDLQPWASANHSLEDEAKRFLDYITSPQQISCGNALENGVINKPWITGSSWLACLDGRYSLAQQIKKKQCRVYSLGLGSEDKQLEVSLAKAGCEVHCFNPSIKVPHVQEAQRLWHHRLSVDWRDPNPAIPPNKQHSNTKKLGAILNDFGHRKIDVLKADMESAEWKILENLVLENVIDKIGQLLFEVHLHWPGFEVSGDDSTVVRYWYSLLKELEHSHFRLFHSHRDDSKPQVFLQKNLLNASSSYTLSWVNTKWRHQ